MATANLQLQQLGALVSLYNIDPAHVEKCVSLRVCALEGLKGEDILCKTKKGPNLLEIIDHLLGLKSGHIAGLSVALCDELETCLASTAECILPNQMWRRSHQVRLNHKLRLAWSKFIMSASLPHHLHSHSNQCFQILIFKDMIARRKESVSPVMPDDDTLSVCEENALHYMSGYVAFHLLKNTERQQQIESRAGILLFTFSRK